MLTLNTETHRYPVPRAKPGPAWSFLDAEHGGRYSKSVSWFHAAGWFVHHCGHPSAHFPWYITHVSAPKVGIFTFNGRGFASVYVARFAVEGLVAGFLEASSDRCAPGILRVLTRKVAA